MRFLKESGAFTLIEILTVITIILILIGLFFPAANRAREQAKVKKAEAMVNALEVAINMYYTDMGKYPSSLDKLINPENDNYGPYMDTEDFKDGEFKDPWGVGYNYRQPGLHNTDTFDVWSSGSGKDIGNW